MFFKELKLATFDPALAAALGFAPVALHYALMAGAHLRWSPDFAARVVRRAERQGLVMQRAEWIDLTPEGRALAREALVC